jgi:hypothetical protein
MIVIAYNDHLPALSHIPISPRLTYDGSPWKGLQSLRVRQLDTL